MGDYQDAGSQNERELLGALRRHFAPGALAILVWRLKGGVEAARLDLERVNPVAVSNA